MKKALITGVTGQDGSYLAEFLLKKGYEVHGVVRRASTFNRQRIDHLRKDRTAPDRLYLHYGDLGDTESLITILADVKPDEVYNLAAQSHVGISFSMPTHEWFEFIKNDPPLYQGIVNTPRLVVFGGGYPIKSGDAVIGGIGVSGGHYSQDMEVAEAGLAALE